MTDENSSQQNQSFEFESIAVYRSRKVFTYDAGRQSREDSDDEGEIIFNSGFNFEQALEDLKGFERIWILFIFDRNSTWSPKVMPPRGSETKKSVFATRSPYRPNPIGLSCVRLIDVNGRTLKVKGADLLHDTPILDIKPYLAYADSFPNSHAGWLEGIENQQYSVEFSTPALQKLNLLSQLGFPAMKEFIEQQLEYEPVDDRRKRVTITGPNSAVLAYRTFRASFKIEKSKILVEEIFSGYTEADLASEEDRYEDKAAHRELLAAFSNSKN